MFARSTNRAMRRPPFVERAKVQALTLFFFYPNHEPYFGEAARVLLFNLIIKDEKSLYANFTSPDLLRHVWRNKSIG